MCATFEVQEAITSRERDRRTRNPWSLTPHPFVSKKVLFGQSGDLTAYVISYREIGSH